MTETNNFAKQIYSNYPALWHLQSMGVLNESNQPNNWPEIKEGQRKTRVAIIDTSVAVDHHCLKDSINRDLALDLFSSRLGTFPYYPEGATLQLSDLNFTTDVASDLPKIKQLFTEFESRLSINEDPLYQGVEPMTSSEFSNHGTAIAGLVGARPISVPVAKDYHNTDTDDVIMPLPYMGVDPMCEIVPISTNFDNDPEMMILAFVYAELIKADVILLPRDIPDPLRMEPYLNNEEVDGIKLGDAVAQIHVTDHDKELWAELSQLIVNISQKRPIVCAAGNGQEDSAIYPANLASEHNGIISVGSVNAKGHRSGYSGITNLTVMAPSNDGEVFDRFETRLDEQDVDYTEVGIPSPNDNEKYSHYDIISTDVPGNYGYAFSPYTSDEPEDGLREFGSYFCRFGGTSAASAIVAGFLSLGKSCNEIGEEASGVEVKNWLLSKCKTLSDGDQTFSYPVWYGSASFPDGSETATA